MHIATIVFTYNRSCHTKQTLDALKKNDLLPEKLYIFQDGLKCEEHRSEWEKVKSAICSVDWCECEVIERTENKGLANSVISGINYVMQEYDAVIVLEDDCVTHPKFMRFVTDGLKKYKDHHKVYQVSGYVWPTEVLPNGSDAYFTGRASSWGWATWKDRWGEYKQDYRMLARINRDEQLARQLSIWGEDLESFLYGNISGRIDSWLVFWALLIIERGGFCLNPYESLVDNIGFDGTGVHCGSGTLHTKMRAEQNLKDILLPDEICFPENYEYAYRDYFVWTPNEVKLSSYNKILLQWLSLLQEGKRIADYFVDRKMKKIAIWGRGNLCERLIRELEGKVEVSCIVESKTNGMPFKGIPAVALSAMPNEVELIVVIPVYDLEKIRKRAEGISGCEMIALDKLLTEI